MKKIKNSKFYKNYKLNKFFNLAFFTGIGQILPLFSFPIITNYLNVIPSDFGNLAIYISSVNILAVLTGLGFNILIPTEKNINKVLSILKSSLITSFILNIFILIIVIIFSDTLQQITDLSPNIFYLMPINVFLINLCISFYYYNFRINKIFISSFSKLLRGSIYSFLLILFSYFMYGYKGMIFSYFLSWLVCSIYFIFFSKITLNNILTLNNIVPENLKDINLILPGQILNKLSSEIIFFLFYFFYDKNMVGLFYKAFSYIMIPCSFIATIVQDYFRQIVVYSLNEFNFNKALYNLLKIIFILSIPFTLVYFLIDYLIILIFPNEYIEISYFSKILLFLAFFMVTLSPFSGSIIHAYRNFKLDLVWQIIFSITINFVLLICIIFNLNIFVTSIYYVLACIIMYSLQLYFSYLSTKNNAR